MKEKAGQELLKNIHWKQFLVIEFLLWSVFALLVSLRSSIYQLSQGKEVFWAHIFIYNYNAAFLWIVLTPMIFLVTVHLFFNSKHWYQALIKHVLFALLIAPVHTFLFLFVDYLIQNWLNLWLSSMTFWKYLSSYSPELIIDAMLTYSIIVGLMTGFILYLRNQSASKARAQLEENLLKSRISNLKYQLQPHFLFNSMQTISNLLHKDTQLADKAIVNLSDILRFSINQLNQDFTSLKVELDITRKYLDFQKLRFSEMVQYDIVVADDLLDYKVPTLLLQPLVENSIKHGFEHTGKPVFVHIKVSDQNGQLHFEIKDDGIGFQQLRNTTDSGTGITNLINRLDHFYSDNYDFQIIPTEKGSQINIILPKIIQS